MAGERDLFRAIVLAAVALVAGPACGGDDDPAPSDSGAGLDATSDDGGALADARPMDAPPAVEDTGLADAGEGDEMVLIL